MVLLLVLGQLGIAGMLTGLSPGTRRVVAIQETPESAPVFGPSADDVHAVPWADHGKVAGRSWLRVRAPGEARSTATIEERLAALEERHDAADQDLDRVLTVLERNTTTLEGTVDRLVALAGRLDLQDATIHVLIDRLQQHIADYRAHGRDLGRSRGGSASPRSPVCGHAQPPSSALRGPA